MARGKERFGIRYKRPGDKRWQRPKSFGSIDDARRCRDEVLRPELEELMTGVVTLRGLEALEWHQIHDYLKGYAETPWEVVREWVECRKMLDPDVSLMKAAGAARTMGLNACKIPIAEVRQSYLDNPKTKSRLRPSTIRGYKSLSRQLVDFLENAVHAGVTLSEVTVELLVEFVNVNSFGLKTCSHRRNIACVLFAYARDELRCLPAKQNTIADHVPRIELPKEHPIPDIFSVEEVLQMITYWWRRRHRENDAQRLVYLVVSLFAGLRPEEITRVRWEDVSFSKHIIRVWPFAAKTRKYRSVPVPECLMKFLRVLRLGRSGPICTTSIASSFHKRVKKYLGMEWKYDGLRHTHATMSMMRGGGRRAVDVSEEMGNSEAVLLRHYFGEAESKAAVKRYWRISPESLPQD